ncbi:hypothetical protein MRB53_037490 [Persea americana]|nr:hypothetical protein MRB53_037490 [Persea americana]
MVLSKGPQVTKQHRPWRQGSMAANATIPNQGCPSPGRCQMTHFDQPPCAPPFRLLASIHVCLCNCARLTAHTRVRRCHTLGCLYNGHSSGRNDAKTLTPK